jgi:serine/threonine protein kinase/Tfp pilus assembly protein PilF
MNDKRWAQIEQLYHSTLEKDERDRAAFLASASGGDEDLRREVESLLAYEDRADNFIESPAVEVAARLMAQNARAKVLAGQTINQYRIVEPLGAGGMGEVYLAEDRRLSRKVALKFLPEHLVEDKDHLRRFEQEARAIAGLSHPNVCTIHEVIETEEQGHCIVMEYVDGTTLRERISKGRMNVSEALDVAIQTASALSGAHAAGVIHRDVKPDNIMTRHDGYVKVLDFGLAKLTETRTQAATSETETRKLSDRTTPGLVMGTVAYMSPEQARGLPVDSRTDIWSLGVVIYEMITGQKPFRGKTPTDVIVSIASQEPAPPTSFSSDVPAKLDQIVSRALAKDADRRYQAADELLSDLKNLRRDLDLQTGVNTLKDHGPNVFTRNRVLIVAAVVVMLIVAGFVYTSFIRQRSIAAPPSEIRSLAVLPLENLSGDLSQEYFADGMTDALITDLAKIGALRVISRPTVMQYKGVRKPLTQIGQELKVDAILTGTVMRSADQVRISVQLFQIATEENRLWGDSYDRDFRDMLALQRDVTQDIVGKIRIKLTPQEQGRIGNVRAVKPEAYDEYLRGKFYLNPQDREGNEAAIAALENAIKIDDSFAAAHAELAQAYVWKLYLFAPNEPRLAERAYTETNKALQLDPDSAVAYLARGRLQWTPANSFPHERAIQDYKVALQLDPNLDEARNQLALVYSHIGMLDESLRESQKAINTNPTNNLAQFRIGETLNFQGKYEQGLVALRGIPAQTNPELVGQQVVWALFNLGRKEEAASKLEQLLKDHPEDNRGLLTSLQAILAASAGQQKVAEEKINLAISRGKGFGHFHHTTYYIAVAYALMNKTEEAMKYLEATANDGFPCYPMFAQDKNLNSLRKDPRFVTFLERQRTQWELSRKWVAE